MYASIGLSKKSHALTNCKELKEERNWNDNKKKTDMEIMLLGEKLHMTINFPPYLKELFIICKRDHFTSSTVVPKQIKKKSILND